MLGSLWRLPLIWIALFTIRFLCIMFFKPLFMVAKVWINAVVNQTCSVIQTTDVCHEPLSCARECSLITTGAVQVAIQTGYL